MASDAAPKASSADVLEPQEETISAEPMKTETTGVDAQPMPPSTADALNGDQAETPHADPVPGDAQGHLVEATDEPQVAETPATPAASTEEQTDAPKPAQQAERDDTTKHDQAISEVAEDASCPKGEEELEKARCRAILWVGERQLFKSV